MEFSLKIDCSNAAFEFDRAAELARILRELADKLDRESPPPWLLHDVNGNRVGKAELR